MIKRLFFFVIIFCMAITCLVYNIKFCVLYCNENGMIRNNENNIISEGGFNGVYIYLDKDDYVDLKNRRTMFHRVLYTNDSLIVNEFIQHSKFSPLGGDICTCTSFIYFTRNDTIQEEYGCCFSSKGIGIQSSKLGYLEDTSDTTLKLIERFEDKIGFLNIEFHYHLYYRYS